MTHGLTPAALDARTMSGGEAVRGATMMMAMMIKIPTFGTGHARAT